MLSDGGDNKRIKDNRDKEDRGKRVMVMMKESVTDDGGSKDENYTRG